MPKLAKCPTEPVPSKPSLSLFTGDIASVQKYYICKV